jgi:hypothetical protein
MLLEVGASALEDVLCNSEGSGSLLRGVLLALLFFFQLLLVAEKRFVQFEFLLQCCRWS